MKAAKTNAKMLVRNRNQVKKMYEMKANLIGVKTNIMNMKSTHAMTSAMKNTAKAMMRMNQQFKLPQMQKIMKEFMREQEKMQMMGDEMGDMIDDTVAGGMEEEEEVDAEVSKVLEEIGIEATEALPSAGADAIGAGAAESSSSKAPAAAAAVGMGGGGGGAPSGGGGGKDDDDSSGGGGGGGTSVDDLQSRLDNLKR